jgi:hypothetical protein
MLTITSIAALLACAVLSTAQAQPVAARINGQPLYGFTLDAMLHNAPSQQAKPSPAVVLDVLVANRLLAAWARERFSAVQLYPAAAVGFAPDVALDDKLVGTLRAMHAKELEVALRALPGAILDSYRIEPAQMDQLFGTPGKLRLDYTLDATQTALAKQVRLMRYTIGKAAPATLSMHDVLRRQNVQGRMEFFNRNVDFMQQQARASVATRFVLEWAGRRFGAGPLADLRQALAEQDEVRAAMTLYGLIEGAETESPVQAALVQQVTQAEVKAWYAAHKEQFKTTARVKARHIRAPSEALAGEVVAAAAQGQDFGQLARRYSTAADAGRGGDLGWVAQTSNPDWLAALVLLQPEGKVSSPFRTAVGADQAASWEILLVEKRIETYHPPGSETVRYLARKAIAQEKARAQFTAAREQLMRSAVIEGAP